MDIVIVLVLILVVVLLWRGPKTLPRLGESLGDAIRSVRRATNEPASESSVRPRDPDEDRREG